MKKRFVFVEDDDPAFRFDGVSGVIAVTPMASYGLGRRGIPFKILEDYYSETELRRGADAYFDGQLRWVEQWDAVIRKHVRFCAQENLSIVRAHLNRIKYVLDSFVCRAAAFRAFFDAERPSEIVYLVRKHVNSERRSFYDVHDRSLCGYAEIIQCWAESEGEDLKFSFVDAAGPSGPRDDRARVPFHEKIISRIRRACLLCSATLAGFFSFRQRPPKAFLFLDWGVPSVEEIAEELLKNGHRVWVKTGDQIREAWKILCLDAWARKTKGGLEREIREGFAKAEAEFLTGELPGWIDQKCGGKGFVRLLEPYARDFFETLGPKTCLEISRLMHFILKNQVACIVARASSGENYPAALQAAARLGLRRVCLQHSCGVSDEKDWAFDELKPFTDSLAMCSYMTEYFKEASLRYGLGGCRVAEYPQVLLKLAGVGPSQPHLKEKMTVLYAPRKLAGWGIPHLNSVAYPITWFYRLQQALIDYFGGVAGTEFVYKHTHQRWSDQSVLKYLEDKNYGNIRPEAGPLRSYLSAADRILFDYPSTGFFEAMACGKPVLCLYHESVRVGSKGLEYFGRCLRGFSTIAQAVEHVERFLDADPRDFSCRLALAEPKTFLELVRDDVVPPLAGRT